MERKRVFLDAEDETGVLVCGRDLWALRSLIEAGETGCTPITRPAPRWSHYIWKLRGVGIVIETIHEPHGGSYPGTHARYVLRSKVRLASDRRAAA